MNPAGPRYSPDLRYLNRVTLLICVSAESVHLDGPRLISLYQCFGVWTGSVLKLTDCWSQIRLRLIKDQDSLNLPVNRSLTKSG